jgi:hypothetical protein
VRSSAVECGDGDGGEMEVRGRVVSSMAWRRAASYPYLHTPRRARRSGASDAITKPSVEQVKV